MYGCYKINFLDKKNKSCKRSLLQKNSITDEGKKKVLDMLSYNLSGTYGYKIAKNIHNGTFELEGKKFSYRSSFFGWGKVSHPFNEDSYTELAETEIAKQVLTENYNLTESQVDKILSTENKRRIDWGFTDSQTIGSNNGYELSSYKTWFNIGIGMVEYEEKFTLPLINETSEIMNSDYEIKLFGNPIYRNTVEVISEVIPDAKPYVEGRDYNIDYKDGKLKIINDDLRKNLSVSGTIRNEIKISYVWNGARYIDELKNGICGVYVNAQPSMKLDSSSYGSQYYFGMGTFSYDNGESWTGYSFPWKGFPLEKINKNSIDPRAGMNMTGFFASNTEFEHFFPTFPYTFINPTNFAFAFCTNGENSFQIRNLNFLVPEFPPFTINEIEIVSDSKSIKKSIEWCGTGEEDDKFFAEWKMYLNADEGNEIDFSIIRTYFDDKMKNLIDGWNDMQYPDKGEIMFSEANFLDESNNPSTWRKNSDEVVEISYRIYFNEV